MDKYKNKYRIPSARLQTWNYSSNASYFVTICSHHMTHFFGKVHQKLMQHSSLGTAAKECWIAIPQHFPHVQLGAFIIMPNHVHGIITPLQT